MGRDFSGKADDYRRMALKAGRRLIKLTRKTAQHRTEGLQMVGTCYWINHQPAKAFTWWRRAVMEGKKLGAHLELSRCYAEIGKRLLSAPVGYSRFDGLDSRTYLDMARQMFLEMELRADLKAIEAFTCRWADTGSENIWDGGAMHA